MFKAFIRNIHKKGFFHLLTANYFIGFLGFASQLLVVKFLTPAEMGQIKTLQSYIAVFSLLAGFGFNTAVLKMCSERVDLSLKRKLLNQNILLTVLSSLMIFGFIILVSKFSVLSVDNEFNNWFVKFSLIIPAMVMSALFIAYLQALKEIQLMAKTQSLIRVFGVFVLVLSTYFWGLAGFLWGSVFIAYLGLIAIIFVVKEHLFFKLDFKFCGRNFNYAAWSTAANFVGVVAMYFDILLLSHKKVDAELLGYYSISTVFILGLNFITQTVQSITTPYFSEKSSNEKEFMVALKKYQKLMILTSMVVAVCSFFIIPAFVNFFYGEKYILVGKFFRLLTLKYVFWSSYSLVGVAILSLGKMKVNFWLSVLGTLIFFGLAIVLFNSHGIWGVAYAQAIAYFFNFVFITFFGLRYIKSYFSNEV